MRSAPLDGVRALAVASVLAFHAHYGWATGGYVGVDVFFVLSGYLITGVLLSTHRSWWGYRQFLVRRAVRLGPALLAATVVATWVAVVTDAPSPAGRCASASLGYFMNLPFVEPWHCTAMWHITWSLSAEEQFYVLWPLVLGGLALLLRRVRSRSQGRGRGLMLAAGLCAVVYAVSVLWQLVLRAHGATTERVTFSPDGRSLVLLLGCGLALALAARQTTRIPQVRAYAGPLSVVSLLALGGCLLYGHLGREPFNAWPLVVSGLAATGLVAGLVHLPPNAPVARALGAAPVAWLGRISYSLYLWHEVGYRLAEQAAPRGTLTAEVLRFVLAALFAVASYYLVELPTQRAWKRRGEEPPEPVRVLEPVTA